MLRDPEREKDSPELVYHVRGDIYCISKWRRYTKYPSESFVRAKDRKAERQSGHSRLLGKLSAHVATARDSE